MVAANTKQCRMNPAMRLPMDLTFRDFNRPGSPRSAA